MIPMKHSPIQASKYYYQTEPNSEDIQDSPDNNTCDGYFGHDVETMIAAQFGHGTDNDINTHIHVVVLSVHHNAEK